MKKSHRLFLTVTAMVGLPIVGCTLIAEVDRSKIPSANDGGTSGGGEGGAATGGASLGGQGGEPNSTGGANVGGEPNLGGGGGAGGAL